MYCPRDRTVLKDIDKDIPLSLITLERLKLPIILWNLNDASMHLYLIDAASMINVWQ